MAVKWHVNGEGKPGKCSAGAGKCPFGADAPHYGTKREAEAAAEKFLAASASGFSVSIQAACGFREAFPGDDAFMVDAAGRFYRRDGNEATVVTGDSVERWDGASGRTVDIVNGGGVHELNVDDGYVRSVFGVNGGVVGGGFRANRVLGCWFDEVTGEATLSEVGGDRNESSREAASRINVLSGDARVLSLASNCHIGSVADNSKVNGVYGGSIGVVSGHGSVNIVQDGGRVSSVVDGGSVNRVEGDGATVGFIGGGLGVGERGGVVYRVHSGGHVETVAGRGAVEVVGPGGSVDTVDGKGRVQTVTSGGRVDFVLGDATVDCNEGVVCFVGAPVASDSGGGGKYGATLGDNRATGRVECVRSGGVVLENMGMVDLVSPGGTVERVCDDGVVRSLSGVVRSVSGPSARVEAMSGSEKAWASIGLVRASASANEGDGARERPVVGFVGPYSRVSFETSSAEEALACIGRVDRGALEAGLVDIRYRGRMGESLLPLLMEREGVSVEG